MWNKCSASSKIVMSDMFDCLYNLLSSHLFGVCVWSGSSLSVVDAPIIEVGVLLEGGGVAFPSI